ncbi:MAG: nickel pincer cofactor biosynthesis protein LarB [Gammaproteobacteria bacterium]|nr:nickel pincer cofactor biosynthesis protein LarB [Gammaproteobacteria bacterium]MDE0364895.1 nickel pincer cofactor biosynthesis protein LarB [Gammaproteobacteria bacterium]
MKGAELEQILADCSSGSLALDEAAARIRAFFFQDLGHSTLDTDRERRTGAAEVIYGQHKTPEQIADLVSALSDNGQNALVTRASRQAFDAVLGREPEARYHETAAAITLTRTVPPPPHTTVAVITAGTSDLPVAEEAAVTAEFYGNPVNRINDVGVSGIHRLLARLDAMREARVLIVVAGMEGALPSVVAGLVDKPVIAVPTSVGYGASFGGVAALLGMLSSCASGLAVVNIDNGFGAGYLANTINRL